MNDDELIQRLRRTLGERADGLHPTPGHVPAPEWAGGGTAAAGGLAGGVGNGVADEGSVSGERRTAEYAVLPPTGPVPIIGGRRRPPGVVVGAIVAAAAAAAIVAVVLTSGTHRVTVRPAGQPSPSLPSKTATVPGPATATTTPQVTPATAPTPVPAGFEPMSVTFVSPDDGWALGGVECGHARCSVLTATTDAGQTWHRVAAPPVLLGAGVEQWAYEVRFGNTQDGWIYASPKGGSSTTPLWSTHDGGTTWNPVPLPLGGATIGDLEASGGRVHMAVYGPCPPGSQGCQGQTEEQILSSPVGSDSWTAAALQPNIGAGPVLQPQLTLWGTSGWLINDNRTVVSGARLSGTAWSTWKPACSSAGGAGFLGAASAADLVAVCAEGVWGPPDAGTSAGHSWLFRSADGGTRFSAVGQVPGDQPKSITVAPGNGQTVVVADGQQGLVASFDGGAHWSTVATTSGSENFGFVGFTTATQGVAVRDGSAPGLLMTRDGGHNWSPVSF